MSLRLNGENVDLQNGWENCSALDLTSTQDASHQDYETFFARDLYKSLFAGVGVDPSSTILVWNKITSIWKTNSFSVKDPRIKVEKSHLHWSS